ncbi:hypothetical protein HPP92_003978 [Vanilla planifolia]|uniref:BHLH domain-containing protein n=1 Tax=Vanilla planifolia TaxID=51239 RepID=A0A835VP55_VANPL|nr:hypothetical protein HPP92_003978 [Vanilla planifolia]
MNSALKIEAYASSNLGLPDGFQVNKSLINKSQVLACSGNVKSEKDSLQSHGNSSNSSYGLPVGCFDECRFSNSNTVVANQGIEKVNCFGNCTSSYGKVHSINCDNDPGLVLMSNEQPSSFPLANFGDDLFEALGLYGSLAGREVSEQLFSEDVSDCNAQLNHSSKFYSANDDMSCTEIFSDPNADQLLDAVVSKIKANIGQSLDENVSCKTSVTRVSDTSLYRGSPSNDGSASSGKKRRENISPVLNSNSEAAGSSSVWSADSMDETGRSEFHKSQMSLWVESGQAMKSDSLFSSHGKRVDDICKVNRKRPRAGETPRPRPKDRQLIMDRVKELREIVPNGAKCSIDALLEKTIKHMLFLQSVTKHADRLKEIGEPKIISKDGGVLLKDNIQGGATWAFDVGSQPVSCPIIVEDLNPPREMLVEMLCEERGMFLEIADLIRGLGLTILKGVMEAHKDKIWARFAVEANRDVTRMEIFLSLVRLLEPTISDAATLHSLYNSNIHRNYFNAPVLPATGMSDPLQ